MTALYESAELGRAVQVPLYEPARRPDEQQEIRRPPVSKPETVNAAEPSL